MQTLSRTYLSPASGSGDAANIIAGMMKPSFEDPSMPVVTKGDPTKSFLMYKMDGNLNGLTAQCAKGEAQSCGVLMPQTSTDPLSQTIRDTVRAWITQGAKNN